MADTLTKLAEQPQMAATALALAALQNDLVARLTASEAGGADVDFAELESHVHTEIERIQRLALDGLKARHAAVGRGVTKAHRKG